MPVDQRQRKQNSIWLAVAVVANRSREGQQGFHGDLEEDGCVLLSRIVSSVCMSSAVC